MTAIQLNAEIYEALSIIAKDESLLRKAAKALKVSIRRNAYCSV